MPGHFEETSDVLSWLKENADGRAIISLMNQYTPVPFEEAPDRLTARSSALSSIENRLVTAEEDADIESLAGFFYYRGKQNTRNFCLIDNISLIRMHELTPDTIAPVDTLTTDSADIDTVPEPPSKRLTPEEIRRLNQTNEHINIQTAPSVRRPNSIGPRRRKK